jgi:hypothetical protein
MSPLRAVASATATATATVGTAAAGTPIVPALVAGCLILAIAAGALHAILTALVAVLALVVVAVVTWTWLRRPHTTVIVQPLIRVRLVERDAPVRCRCGLPTVTIAQITGPDGAAEATLCEACLVELLGEVERRALTAYGTATVPALEVRHDH